MTFLSQKKFVWKICLKSSVHRMSSEEKGCISWRVCMKWRISPCGCLSWYNNAISAVTQKLDWFAQTEKGVLGQSWKKKTQPWRNSQETLTAQMKFDKYLNCLNAVSGKHDVHIWVCGRSLQFCYINGICHQSDLERKHLSSSWAALFAKNSISTCFILLMFLWYSALGGGGFYILM